VAPAQPADRRSLLEAALQAVQAVGQEELGVRFQQLPP
jgi:hypothetical protein